MKHSHRFIEPYLAWPATIDADVLAIDAAQAKLSNLRQTARAILADPAKHLPDMVEAAQCLIDTGDDAADLEWLLEQVEASERFAEQCEAYEMRTGKDWTSSEYLCALEQETFNPEPLYAAQHVAAKPAEASAALNAEWL